MNNDNAMVKREGVSMLSEALERLADSISRSTIIPAEFKNNPSNCLIALEMAHRIGAGVLQVMQSLYIVHGKPSWSGQFIIGAVNSTKRFTPLRFEFNSDKTECVAVCEDHDGNELRGPAVSVDMAKKEGWWERNAKWKNMTELMLMYRAGTFFGRVYASDVLMGMREQYEVLEAQAIQIKEAKIEAPANGKKHFTEQGHPLPVVEEKPAKKPAKKKLQVKPEQKPEPPKNEAPLINETAGPNRHALIERLAVGKFTEADFLVIANHNEWLGKGKRWMSMSDVPDDMLEVFLQPDEWETVMEQLEKLRPSMAEK